MKKQNKKWKIALCAFFIGLLFAFPLSFIFDITSNFRDIVFTITCSMAAISALIALIIVVIWLIKDMLND